MKIVGEFYLKSGNIIKKEINILEDEDEEEIKLIEYMIKLFKQSIKDEKIEYRDLYFGTLIIDIKRIEALDLYIE